MRILVLPPVDTLNMATNLQRGFVPMENKYMFIDGAYLRAVIRDFGEYWYGQPEVPFQFDKFARWHNKVFYYDCLPAQGANEKDEDFQKKLEAQQKLFQKLRSQHGWHVQEGIVKRGRKDKATQKEVDVMIAVDMLTHTYRRNMNELTFVAGDQDFLPLVEALVREGMFVNLLYEKESGSRDLINAADARQAMDIYLLHDILSVEFQSKHPVPHRFGAARGHITNGVPVCSSVQHDGLPVQVVRILEPRPLYSARIDDPENQNIICYEHEDLEFLKKVLDDRIATKVWLNA